MADKKISALTAASTPLAGTEVLPIVQSGATVKVAVSDLTAGRAISATQITLTAGNVIPANGYGIDFAATAGTGTSELLADYEEGDWTPVIVPQTGTITSQSCSGRYTKVGRIVTIQFSMVINTIGTGNGLGSITGLPFTSANVAPTGGAAAREGYATGQLWFFLVGQNATTMNGWKYDNDTTIGNYGWVGSLSYSV